MTEPCLARLCASHPLCFPEMDQFLPYSFKPFKHRIYMMSWMVRLRACWTCLAGALKFFTNFCTFTHVLLFSNEVVSEKYVVQWLVHSGRWLFLWLWAVQLFSTELVPTQTPSWILAVTREATWALKGQSAVPLTSYKQWCMWQLYPYFSFLKHLVRAIHKIPYTMGIHLTLWHRYPPLAPSGSQYTA